MIFLKTARNPPAAPLYLDCDVTGPGVCVLRWGVPDTVVGGDPITNTVIEYREQEGAEWQSVEGLIQGNKHTFGGEKCQLGD